MQTADRQTLIARIANSCRKPCAPIREIKHLPCSDGRLRSVFGIPHGVTVTGDAVTVGFAYVDPINGTTYGSRFNSPEDAIANWERNENAKAEEFRVALEKMTDERLAEQAEYWLNR